MQIIDNGKFKKLVADEGKKLFSPYTNSYHDYVILGKNQEESKFKEVNDPYITQTNGESTISVNELINIFNNVVNE